MAIIGYFENASDRQSSGNIRETPEYSRAFTVRVDDPNTSLLDIAAAPGIHYGDVHPEDESVYVTNVEVTAEGDSLLIYKVRYTYSIVTAEAVSGGASAAANAAAGGAGGSAPPPDPLSLPVDYWSGTSSLYQQETFQDAAGNPLVNTAGTPFPRGASRDKVEQQLTLTRSYAINQYGLMMQHCGFVGYVNSTAWPGTGDGSEIGWWRLSGSNWAFREQSSGGVRLPYYEATFNFSYRRGLTFDASKMVWLGGNGIQANYGSKVPPWAGMVPSMGYDELAQAPNAMFPKMVRTPIMRAIEYRNCAGAPITPPAGDPNDPCEWPIAEEVTEPQPLDIDGRLCAAGKPPALILINTLPGVVDFHTHFGDPDPTT